MQLDEITAWSADQDRGRDFQLLDPVTGSATGIVLRIAGPDSATAGRARLALADRLSELAEHDGRVTAAQREGARLAALAACVLGWEITEGGDPVPFSQAGVLRLLRAAVWVREQVGGFAGDRGAFRGAV